MDGAITDVFIVFQEWGTHERDGLHISKVYRSEDDAKAHVARVEAEDSTHICWYEKRALF